MIESQQKTHNTVIKYQRERILQNILDSFIKMFGKIKWKWYDIVCYPILNMFYFSTNKYFRKKSKFLTLDFILHSYFGLFISLKKWIDQLEYILIL